MRLPRLPKLGPRARLALRLGATILVLGLCVWAGRKLDLRGGAHVAASASPGWLIFAALLNFPFALMQSLRWKLLIRAAGRLPLLSAFRYLLASRAASNLLPARAGELVRIYLPSARDGLPPVSCASILLIERFFDAAGLAAISIPLLLVPAVPGWVRSGVLVLVGSALAGLTATFVLAFRGSRKRTSILDRIAQAAEPVRNLPVLAGVVGITLVDWVAEAGMVAACMAAVGLPVTMESALLVLLAVNLGLVVQVTPANVGPYEASAILALAALGLTGPKAVAMAVLYHLVQVVPVTLAGLEGLRFVGEARRAEAAARAAPPEPAPEPPKA
jgi:glycosyltransferase 2 family protein